MQACHKTAVLLHTAVLPSASCLALWQCPHVLFALERCQFHCHVGSAFVDRTHVFPCKSPRHDHRKLYPDDGNQFLRTWGILGVCARQMGYEGAA
eukprot:scaffold50819_cov21-Tisochrysis_lutea.AAC.1